MTSSAAFLVELARIIVDELEPCEHGNAFSTDCAYCRARRVLALDAIGDAGGDGENAAYLLRVVTELEPEPRPAR